MKMSYLAISYNCCFYLLHVTASPFHGFKITFIRSESPLYSLWNHSEPSDNGAALLIKDSTSTLPEAIRSRQSGYSSEEAQEPYREICLVTTYCSGKSTLG